MELDSQGRVAAEAGQHGADLLVERGDAPVGGPQVVLRLLQP